MTEREAINLILTDYLPELKHSAFQDKETANKIAEAITLLSGKRYQVYPASKSYPGQFAVCAVTNG